MYAASFMSSRSLAPLVLLLNLTLLITFLRVQLSRGCKVSVKTPWEEYTHITSDSEVRMSCSKEGNLTIAWAILFVESSENAFQFSVPIRLAMLNSRGLYELPHVERDGISTIRLLINSTDSENISGTVIVCSEFSTPNAVYNKTTLIVDDPVPVRIHADVVALHTANITVSRSNKTDSDRVYSLAVSSENTNTSLYEFQSDSYTFTAPEGAPPCEVYNFSVTASFLGANYSDCSLSSSVISKMLPSLPDKKRLESTLNYSLLKSDANEVTISVSVEDTSHYCGSPAFINYTLVTENAFNPSERRIESMKLMDRLGTMSSLPENGLYVFRIVVSNTIGSITTDDLEIYTTDVQEVTAVELRDFDAFRVGCNFIGGSNARGCVVVLVGDLGNMTVQLNKRVHTIRSMHPTSCYRKVIAYDLEEDGTVGRLAVPGNILSDTTSNSVALCLPRLNTTSPSMNNMVLILMVVIGLLFITALCTFLISCIIICRLKKQSRFKTVIRSKSLDELPAVVVPCRLSAYSPEPVIPLYDSPRNVTVHVDTKMSLSEDDDYDKLRQHEEGNLPRYQRHDCRANTIRQELSLREDEDYEELGDRDDESLKECPCNDYKTNAMPQELFLREDDDYDELQENDKGTITRCQRNDFETYSVPQEEHFYHVLENQRAKQKPTVVIAAEYEMPEYTPPIYQEVGELLVKKRLS